MTDKFVSRLLKEPEERGMLAHQFAERMVLARQTREQARDSIGQEWDAIDKWVFSESRKAGSFYWYCDEFDMEPGSVRRAVKEARKTVDAAPQS